MENTLDQAVDKIINDAFGGVMGELTKEIGKGSGEDDSRLIDAVPRLYESALKQYEKAKNGIKQEWIGVVNAENLIQILGYTEKLGEAIQKLRDYCNKEQEVLGMKKDYEITKKIHDSILEFYTTRSPEKKSVWGKLYELIKSKDRG